MFWLRNKKIIFSYTLLSGGLAVKDIVTSIMTLQFHAKELNTEQKTKCQVLNTNYMETLEILSHNLHNEKTSLTFCPLGYFHAFCRLLIIFSKSTFWKNQCQIV